MLADSSLAPLNQIRWPATAGNDFTPVRATCHATMTKGIDGHIGHTFMLAAPSPTATADGFRTSGTTPSDPHDGKFTQDFTVAARRGSTTDPATTLSS